MILRRVCVRLPQSLKASRFRFRRHYSGFERPPTYQNHVYLTRLERSILALGSAAMSFMNPRRAGVCIQSSLHISMKIDSPWRSGCGTWRDHCYTILHLPPPRCHAFKLNWPPNLARSSKNHVWNFVFGKLTFVTRKQCRKCICLLDSSGGCESWYARPRQIHRWRRMRLRDAKISRLPRFLSRHHRSPCLCGRGSRTQGLWVCEHSFANDRPECIGGDKVKTQGTYKVLANIFTLGSFKWTTK